MSGPVSVAVGLVSAGEKLLLIRRDGGGAYQGLWALPGGKVEPGEHVCAAARREVREETGVETGGATHCGVVSEHLERTGDEAESGHFLLHVCELAAETRALSAGEEGEARWVAVDEFDSRMVPSDRAVLDAFLVRRERGYYESVVVADDGEHRMRAFERHTPL